MYAFPAVESDSDDAAAPDDDAPGNKEIKA
jgi:hypothetical protein